MQRPKIIEKFKEQAAKAVETVLASEKGAAAIMSVMRRVQYSRTKLDEQSTRLINAIGLATKADVDRLSDKLRKVRKQLQSLIDMTQR